MTRPVAIIHFGRALTSVAGVSLCKHARHFVDQLRDTHDFVLVVGRIRKSDFARKRVEAILNIEFRDVITCQQKWVAGLKKSKYANWFEFLKAEDWFADIQNVDKIFIFGGLLSAAAGINRKKRKTNTAVTKNSYMLFDAIANYLGVTLQLILTARKHNAELIEVCYDPEEFSIDLFTDERLKVEKYKLLFPYSIPSYNMERCDYIQHDLRENQPGNKTLDFVFGATFVTPSRYEIWDGVKDVLDAIETQNTELLLTHRKLGLSNSVPYDEYLDKLSQSKFTLVIPAYDTSTFSCIRFMEAISVNCLPLILNGVSYTDFVNSFSLDTDTFEQLIATPENVQGLLDMPSSEYKFKLHYFRKALKL